MTTTESPPNSSANTSPDEPEAPKEIDGIPYDHFENDVSGKIQMNEADLADFDAETDRLIQESKG